MHPTMDHCRLPDEWGYDYARPRFMSPYMRRSLLLAVALISLPFVIAIALGAPA
jgi:hypothetical protein